MTRDKLGEVAGVGQGIKSGPQVENQSPCAHVFVQVDDLRLNTHKELEEGSRREASRP